MKQSKIEQIEQIAESFHNGNISWTMRQIKKMSRSERLEFVEYMNYKLGEADTAFYIAGRIIDNDF